jgi:hypothetical protein
MRRVSHPELRLTSARSDFQKAWRASAAGWRDGARAQFEKEYIDELMVTARTTATAMAELTNLLKRVMRQCS